MTDRPLRLGLVGCGRVAESGYVPAVAGLDRITIAAVADPSAERRERIGALAARHSMRPAAYAGAAELIGSGAVDAVVVGSPPAEHPWQAELASRAGIPCLVEKPPAPTRAEAERLAELDPAPWVGFNRRFQHGARVLPAIPASGPLELELEIRYRRASWRPLNGGDEAVLDLAPHLVDLALLLSGSRTARVRSASLTRERATIELETERGRARIRCATDRAHRELVLARDGRGALLGRSSAGGPLAAIGGRFPGNRHPLVESLRRQLAAFALVARGAQAVNGAGAPQSSDRGATLASAADGARVMRVIDEARGLAANGCGR